MPNEYYKIYNESISPLELVLPLNKNLLFTFLMDNTSEDQFMSIIFY